MRLQGIALALALTAGLATPATAASYGVGTSGQGTITYSAGAAIAKVVSERAGLDLRVQPYGGSSQYVPLISSKEIDFGLANVLEVSTATAGTLVFEGNKSPDLRVVAVVFPLTFGFFVKSDSDIKAIKDLKGRRVPGGYGSQAIIRPVTDALLAAGGLTPADVKVVPVPNVIRGADDFAEGKADTFFFGLGGSKVTQVGASVPLRLLPIDDSPEVMPAVRKIVPQAYVTTALPSDKNVGVVGPTKVLTYDYLFVAGAHVPDEVVYKTVKALHANKKDLAAAFPVFGTMDTAGMAKPLGLTYHPGAVRFYKEAGLWKE